MKIESEKLILNYITFAQTPRSSSPHGYGVLGAQVFHYFPHSSWLEEEKFSQHFSLKLSTWR
jgi:hypothetical protein